jgi:uncharacterized protein YodC (DUF2158 family)
MLSFKIGDQKVIFKIGGPKMHLSQSKISEKSD